MFLWLWIGLVQSVLIQSEYQVADTGGSDQNTFTALTLQISSEDGSLGYDNTGVWEGETQVVTSDLQAVTKRVRVTWSRPVSEMDAFLIGFMPRNWRPFESTICRNRLNPMEQATDILGVDAYFSGRLRNATDTLAALEASEGPGPLIRRLLEISVGQEGEEIPTELKLTPERVGILQTMISNNNEAINGYLDEFDQYNTNRLLPALVQAQQMGTLILGVLQDTEQVSNQTARGLAALNLTAQFVIARQNEVLNNLDQTEELIQQSASSTNSTGAALVAKVQELDDRISAGALGSVAATDVMLSMLTSLQGSASGLLDAIAWHRSDLDQSLRSAKQAIQLIETLRLDSETRRGLTTQYFNLLDLIANQSLDIIPFTSPDLAVRPLGHVESTAGGITEQQEAVRVTLIWNEEIGDPGSDVDPDVDIPLDDLDGDPGQLWDSLRPSDQSAQFRYIQQRVFSIFCDNDFLLENRATFLTIQTLKELVGPVGCTPLVDCNCWVRVERARCSLNGGAFYTSSDTATPPLDEVPDICQSALDLPIWYNNDVPSITSKPAIEFFSAASVFDAEITNICVRRTGGATSADDAPERDFLVYSSFTGVDTNNLGGVVRIRNLQDLCATNHAEMEVQQRQLPDAVGVTLPYLIYGYIRVATTELFRAVSTQWELQKYGTYPFNDVSIDDIPFWLVNTTGQADMPLLTQECQVMTIGFTGLYMEPLYAMKLRPGVQQTITVEILDEIGQTLTQKITTDGSVRFTSQPLSTLPTDMLTAGYPDCMLLPCPTQSLDPNTDDVVFERHLFDTPLGMLGGFGQPETREGKNYIVNFTQDLADSNPFTNPRLVSDFGAMGWKRQNNRTTFDPRLQGRGIDSVLRYLVADTEHGGYKCNGTRSSYGQWCTILDQYEVLPNDPLLPELGGSSNVWRLSPKTWQIEALIYIPGSDVQTVPVQTQLLCPNPQQIRFSFDNKPAHTGLSTPLLTIDNEHNSTINVTVTVVAINGTCDTSVQTVNITSFSTFVFNLLFCDVQNVTVVVNTNPIQTCWNQVLNLTYLASKLGATWYNGNNDLNASVASSGSVNVAIHQEIQNQNDQVIESTIVSFNSMLDADANAIQFIQALRQLRRSSPDLVLDPDQIRAQLAQLLFANQNLQEASVTALALQIQLVDLTINETTVLRQNLSALRTEVTTVNVAYEQLVSDVKRFGGAEFHLTEQQQQAFAVAAELAANLSIENTNLQVIGNRTFAVQVDADGQEVFATLGNLVPPYYERVGGLGSFFNSLGNDIASVGSDVGQTALDVISVLKPDPKCPGGFKIGCDIKNLLTKIGMLLITVLGGAVAVVLVVVVIVQVAKASAAAAKEKAQLKREKRRQRRERLPLLPG